MRHGAGSVGANGLTHDFTFFPLLNLSPHSLSKGTKRINFEAVPGDLLHLSDVSPSHERHSRPTASAYQSRCGDDFRTGESQRCLQAGTPDRNRASEGKASNTRYEIETLRNRGRQNKTALQTAIRWVDRCRGGYRKIDGDAIRFQSCPFMFRLRQFRSVLKFNVCSCVALPSHFIGYFETSRLAY